MYIAPQLRLTYNHLWRFCGQNVRNREDTTVCLSSQLRQVMVDITHGYPEIRIHLGQIDIQLLANRMRAVNYA